MPTPVIKYRSGASPYRCYDMVGNVWEWCADRYDKDFYRKSPPENPQGPKAGTSRVLRGGSFLFFRGNNRAAERNDADPFSGLSDVGMRCVVRLR